MTRLLMLLVLSASLLGCSGADEPGAAAPDEVTAELTAEQACEQAQEATADYNAALKDAKGPEEARQAIADTVERLRGIGAPAPVDAPVSAVADALTAALEAVDAQDQAAFRGEVARIQASTQVLAQTCAAPR